MSLSLGQRVLDREISAVLSRRRAYSDFYGDRQLVQDLDIVNELDGHSGCVNALSWSKSGRLLASGSDDRHLNIHVYQPENVDKQFQLQATVATGHTQNIFSVKFMPQSNDRTVVTCAGDGDVRVFDLEYAGKSTEASAASARAAAGRRARRTNVYSGVRYLSDGNTNARVYRSHGDRVKRVVTESSPYLFLTCSEDGEVRQWDTRQPSEAYPRSATGRYTGMDDNVPPPLISYQKYNLDLNTISCSPSQPHYIALGGAHLHCFLHDRRMIGRDRTRESGRPGVSATSQTDEEMHQATRCVRKFAPRGQQKMRQGDRGHITACKISDARPDEMIVSWSGDHIYSFDLIRSPDADEPDVQEDNNPSKQRPRLTGELKRRRGTGESEASASASALDSATTLRVRYRNGQHEDIRVSDDHQAVTLTPGQLEAQRLTHSILRARETFFSCARDQETLGQCALLLSDIDETVRAWRYPADPSGEQLVLQQKLRSTREAVRRCVQAMGTIARVLSGTLRVTSDASPPIERLLMIDNRMTDLKLCANDTFTFDFLKAILIWLDSGRGKLVEAFIRPNAVSKTSRAAYRLPIPEQNASSDSIEESLLPYLRSLLEEAATTPIVDPEKNRFETDAARQLFSSETAALDAFAEAVSQPFADLSAQLAGSPPASLDRRAAIEFWALRVARGVLLNAFERIDLRLVELAFGGIRTISDAELMVSTELSAVDEEGENVDTIDMITAGTDEVVDNGSAPLNDLVSSATTDDDDDYDDGDYDMDEDDERDEESSDPDEEDGVPNLGPPRFVYQSAGRERSRGKAARTVPCSAAIRTYKGHCNVRTVKDVNYFGLEDEYVVSGSDDGNFFIWDRKTSELINVLEGDGEVVNVIQGHPYETMLAVSGIDHTIKIFSPDNHAREAARLAHGVSAHDPTDFSSLSWPHHLGYMHRRSRDSQNTDENGATTALEGDDEYVAEAGLASRRRMDQAQRIIEENDSGRRGGNNDAVITRSMLHNLAQHLRVQRQGADPDTPLEGLETLEDEDGNVRVVLRDDCAVM